MNYYQFLVRFLYNFWTLLSILADLSLFSWTIFGQILFLLLDNMKNSFFADPMFNRQMYGGGGSKPPQSSKNEANLMPVPSPQQIQYLNPLEGQELTIQKQPNTSLRDQDLLSPS